MPVTHPATIPLLRLVDTLQASAQPLARVESEPDPRSPGRTAYRITAPGYGSGSREAVQREISRVMRTLDESKPGRIGHVLFKGPFRTEAGYEALGEVVEQAAAGAA